MKTMLKIEARAFNNNPVIHFLQVLTPQEQASVDRSNLDFVSTLYAVAVNKVKGYGEKYHNKSFGGGIVFHSDDAMCLFQEEKMYCNATSDDVPEELKW